MTALEPVMTPLISAPTRQIILVNLNNCLLSVFPILQYPGSLAPELALLATKDDADDDGVDDDGRDLGAAADNVRHLVE